jgi:hypothetical protein
VHPGATERIHANSHARAADDLQVDDARKVVDIWSSVQIGAAALPLTAGLLGNAAIPIELWGLVFGGALLAWLNAEAISRFVWSEGHLSEARS